MRKLKKPYKSLDEIYINESFAKLVPELPRQKIFLIEQPEVAEAPTQQQPTQEPQQAQPQQPVQFNQSASSRNNWTPAQQSLFDKVTKKGEGRGEKSVASLITGETDITKLEKYIQGQESSFDVVVDRSTFEVKEFTVRDGRFLGSVRIGKEGAKTANQIIAGITRIFKDMENEYLAMDESAKKQLDSTIVNAIFSGLAEPTQLTGKRGQLIKSKEYQSQLADYQRKTQWSLAGYINAIFDVSMGEDKTIQEFPSNLFDINKEINPNMYRKNPERAKYLIVNIPKLLLTLETLANQSLKTEEPNTASPSLSELQTVLKKYYLPAEDEKYVSMLDKEAENIDRSLTRKKCVATGGENCKTIEDFYKAIKSLKMGNTFNAIEQLRFDEQAILSLFPANLTGLFIVHPQGYFYIVKNDLQKYVYISELTQKGLKIRVK